MSITALNWAWVSGAAPTKLAPGRYVVEPAKATYSLPLATVGSFDITTETANVELGLCARRFQLGSGYDAFVSNAYTLVMAQAK